MTLTAAAAAIGPANTPPNPVLVKIRDVIYQVAGIFHPDNKHRLLEERCAKRMQVLGVASLRDYYDCLTVKPTRQAELNALLNEITIGETCFFRNVPQLDAIRNVALPKIIAARAKSTPRHLRIWSAGCSTGEEPYTLSMALLEEQKKHLKDWTFEILATDLNERSLAQAQIGHYGAYSTRNIPEYFKQKYFLARDRELHVTAEVKAKVNFQQVNLSDAARMAFMKNVDITLCCNVLIYFDSVSKRRVISHFYSNLLLHGYLFLGHAESLYGVSDDFRLVHLPGCTAYLKSENKAVAPEKARPQ
ncbi:MAG TPA: protein-glutamate O-methyltransferase CheR [Terriglobales bacterium]|jgi:chemotaxis protein methyltransferase CheR